MRELETYRLKTMTRLLGVKMYMQTHDFEQVHTSILTATNTRQLDGHHLALGFHRFRIDDAIRRGEIVEIRQKK